MSDDTQRLAEILDRWSGLPGWSSVAHEDVGWLAAALAEANESLALSLADALEDEHSHRLMRERERPWIRRWQQETGKGELVYPDYGEILGWIMDKAEAAESSLAEARRALEAYRESHSATAWVPSDSAPCVMTKVADSRCAICVQADAALPPPERVLRERVRAETAEAALAEARREADALRTMLLRAMEAEDPDEWTMDAQALMAALAPPEREGERS